MGTKHAFQSSSKLTELYAMAKTIGVGYENIMAIFEDNHNGFWYKMRYDNFMSLVTHIGLGVGQE